MSDILGDPQFLAWAKRVQDELVPKVLDSNFVISMIPRGPSDVQFAVQLGLSIMMDKPIIALIEAGTKVPNKLVLIADRIIEVDYKNLEASREAFEKAIEELGLK